MTFMTNLSHSNEKVLTSYSHLQPWPCKSTQATRYIIIRYTAPKCTISVLEYIKEKEKERERVFFPKVKDIYIIL